jgi:cysteinyl-tRNA synthetase
MVLKLFNTLTRKKQEFVSIKKGQVGMYACGPTVYSYQHIGNLRNYIFNDILRRVLEYNNFKVKHVMNYTDVGHLTSDRDSGEDKIEKAAKLENKKASDISKYYANVFEKDCKKLNIIPPTILCKATEHIKEQLELIYELEKKGFTYKTNDGIYFDTSKLNDYGKLGKIDLEGLEAGKRVDVGGKKNKTDFALWKFSKEKGKRQQEWDSKFGIGFPGWHIECSAMSSKYLGNQFDIHTGGEDHVQVHHTNEIAQSESAFSKKPWVKYWVHGAFLTHKGEKVSKSTGGLYTVSDLEELKFMPLEFRYFCLNTHYRKQLSFSIEILKGAKKSYERLYNIIIKLKTKKDSNTQENKEFSGHQKSKRFLSETKNYEKYIKEFNDYINDDLNMPKALSVLWEVLRDNEIGNVEKLELCYEFDKVFGLSIKDMKEDKLEVDKDIQDLIDKRELARSAKDFELADKIRDELKQKGIVLQDSKNGISFKKI